MSSSTSLIKLPKFNLSKFPFSKYLYYGSVFFMLKFSYDTINKEIYTKSKKKQLLSLLKELKEKYEINDQSTSTLEIIYYIYFKCLNEVYDNESKKFKTQRRNYLKVNYLYGYVNLCLSYLKEAYPYEEEILKSIADIFDVKLDVVKSIFSREEVDYRKMKGRYFSQRNDIEIPCELDIKKMDEIIQFLHKKFCLCYNKIKEMNQAIKEYKAQLIAEYYAFDCVFFEYDIEYEVIEKCLYQNNLSVIEY